MIQRINTLLGFFVGKSIKQQILSIVLVLIISLLGCSSLHAQQDSLYGIWARRAPFGSGGNAEINSSITDEHGNVYLSGVFTGALNFADDICNPSMSSVDYNTKGKALFLMKLNSTGAYQWHIVYEVENGIPEITRNASPTSLIYDYKDNKLLVYGRLVYYGSMSTLGVKTTLRNVGGVIGTPAVYTKATGTSNPDRFSFQYLHVVNTADGSTNKFLDPFTAQTQNLIAKFQGNNILTMHMGWDGTVYDKNQSLISIYNGTTGDQIGTNFEYPNQPYASPGASGCGSTVISHVTLADGRQVMVHNTYGKVGDIDNVPSYYLLFYKGDYSAKLEQYLMSQRAIEYFPLLSTDNASNLYVATNYGKSTYWDPQNYLDPTISNSNHLDNFLGTTNNFETKEQCNKVVLTRMNSDYTIKWMFQIGQGNNDADASTVVVKDMKTIGDKTYIVGTFMGHDINFNGQMLTSHDSGHPNYNWNEDVFYAVYNNETGICVYAVNLGSWGWDQGSTVYLTSDASQVIIGGVYTSKVFQPDPAGRLYPLTSNGINGHGFVALYSTDKLSQPTAYASSFGDAPASYGVAVHHVYPCIRLNGLATANLQTVPNHSDDANTALNDDAITIPKNGGYVDLTHADFKLDAAGNLKIKVNVHNSAPTGDAAKLIGWIDFNRNGEFDGRDEASDSISVASGTSGIVELTWAGASSKLRSGKTYMRLRITTDLMDRTQPQGLFFNGEVEDYRLDFNIWDMVKTRESAENVYVGDTVAYKITVTNHMPVPLNNVFVFDPLPDSTYYAENSAMIGNTLVPAQPEAVAEKGGALSVVWGRNISIAANSSQEFRLKVVIKDQKYNDEWTCNAAYAIGPSGEELNTWEAPNNWVCVHVNNLWANNDYYAVLKNGTIESADISANDFDPERRYVEDVIVATYEGTATLNMPRDGTLKYISKTDYLGLDSVDYRIKTNVMTANSKVYVAVVTPVRDEYLSCPNSSITVGMLPDNESRITYEWYDELTGGTSFASGNTATIAFGSRDTIVYVQVSIDGNVISTRIPLEVKLMNLPEKYPHIRVQMCPNIGEINLSKYLDTVGFKKVEWTPELSAPAIGLNDGKINTNNGYEFPNTYVYKYKYQNTCYTDEAKLFLKAVTDSPMGLPPKAVVVCWSNAERLHLNQILGIEAKGVFDADAPVKAFFSEIASPSINAGAIIFNGKDAYQNLSGYTYTHNGDTNAKKITIKYKITDPTSCMYGSGNVEYSLDIILTSVL